MKRMLLILIFSISLLSAAINDFFPKEKSRIIDQAKLISSNTKDNLISILEKHEKETSNQIAIVILNTLHGYEIEDFSYKLARHLKIGQEDKDNGVLLLIAIKEKKIRIEVGYGLEGALTDKISHEIIEYTLKPNFKDKKFEQGIKQATTNILLAINDEYENDTYSNTNKKEGIKDYLFFIFFIIAFISMLIKGLSIKIEHKQMYKISKATLSSAFISIFIMSILNLDYLTFLIFIILSILFLFIVKNPDFKKLKSKKASTYNTNSSRQSNSSSSPSSRGFSGGGGSFGGGGASGGW